MSIIEREEVQTEKPAELDEVGRGLVKSAEIIRRGWCQRALRLSDGRVCAIGAMIVATGGDPGGNFGMSYTPLHKRLRDSLGESPRIFNNAPGRTAEEVAEALERAAYFG